MKYANVRAKKPQCKKGTSKKRRQEIERLFGLILETEQKIADNQTSIAGVEIYVND